MQLPPYPDILKDSNWQKEKSTIAKILPGKKTGIGEAMQDCEAKYSTLVHELAPLATPAQMTQTDKEAASLFGLALQDLEHTAEDAAKKWSAKTSPVPKATRLHAEKIASVARDYQKAVIKLLGH